MSYEADNEVNGYKVTVALPKGRLADTALEMFLKAGVQCEVDNDRQLIFFDNTGIFRFLFVKPSDVPVYVESGVADIGISGKDTIMEEDKDIYEVADLKIGKCKMCIAALKNYQQKKSGFKVATKYPNIAKKYFLKKGADVDIIKLNGSVELAPITGLSDVIMDIVESGRTLKANGLEVKETVADISARIIANRVSFKVKYDIIKPIISKMIMD